MFWKWCQGSPFPTARRPGASKTTNRATGFGQIFLYFIYKQIEEFQNSWSRASDDFEKRRALDAFEIITESLRANDWKFGLQYNVIMGSQWTGTIVLFKLRDIYTGVQWSYNHPMTIVWHFVNNKNLTDHFRGMWWSYDDLMGIQSHLLYVGSWSQNVRLWMGIQDLGNEK